MKKFASVILAVLVAFSMFSFVVSAAAPTLTMTADKTTVKAGDVVTVTVKLSEESGLGALTVDITYDAEAFKAVEMTDGGKEEGLGAVVNPAFAEGTARATIAATTTVEEAGVLCVLKLEALKAADSTVAINIVEAIDGDWNEVTVATNSVAIKGEVVEEPSEDTECKHETMSNWAVTKTATCKKDGVETRNCTVCDYSETRAIPATGKCTYKWVVTKEATATQYGEKQFKCTMCGDVKETQKLAVKGEDSLTNPSIPNTDAIA